MHSTVPNVQIVRIFTFQCINTVKGIISIEQPTGVWDGLIYQVWWQVALCPNIEGIWMSP